ncbi:hypothetical protein D9M70_636760 [compost metagenome]
MPGHADIGKAPIHARGRQQVSPIDGNALGFVNRDGITMIDGGILRGLEPAGFAAVQAHGQASIFGTLDGAKGAVLHA